MADEYVIRGNSAIFKCNIPSFVGDFVSVTSWSTDHGEHFYPSNRYGNEGGKVECMGGLGLGLYSILPSLSLSYSFSSLQHSIGSLSLSLFYFSSKSHLVCIIPTGSSPPGVISECVKGLVLNGLDYDVVVLLNLALPYLTFTSFSPPLFFFLPFRMY